MSTHNDTDIRIGIAASFDEAAAEQVERKVQRSAEESASKVVEQAGKVEAAVDRAAESARKSATSAGKAVAQSAEAAGKVVDGAGEQTVSAGKRMAEGYQTASRSLAFLQEGLGKLAFVLTALNAARELAVSAWEYWDNSAREAARAAERQRQATEELTAAQERLNEALQQRAWQEAMDARLRALREQSQEMDRQLEMGRKMLELRLSQSRSKGDLRQLQHQRDVAALDDEYADRDRDEAYFARLHELEDALRRDMRAIEDAALLDSIGTTTREHAGVQGSIGAQEEQAGRLRGVLKGLRSDEEREFDWKSQGEIEEQLRSAKLTKTQRANLNAHLEALLARNKEEVRLLSREGYGDRVQQLYRQQSRGKSSLTADFEQELKAAEEGLPELKERAKQLAQEIARLEQQRKDNPARDALQDETEQHKRSSEGKKRAAEARARAQREWEEEEMRMIQDYVEESRRAQQQQGEADARALAAQDSRDAWLRSAAGYKGPGRKALSIFRDGKVTRRELGRAGELVELSRENGELREILSKLLDSAIANKGKATSTRSEMLRLRRKLETYMRGEI